MEKSHNKDVIYLEADSEITEAIDKLKSSESSEVRLAVPARSNLFQSAVNLKLLQKAAKSKHKELILISSDKATLSLAAGLGLLVAKNVKAEASVPEMPELPVAKPAESVIEEPVGDSASSKSQSSKKSDSFEKQHINLDDEKPTNESKSARAEKKAKKKAEKNAGKVPNYNGLNKKIWIFIGVVAVIALLILAYLFLPTAKVILTANAQKTPVNVKFTLDSGTKKTDVSEGVIAADQISNTKDVSKQFTPTGKKEVGNKATGNINIKNCDDTNSRNLAAGTTVTNSGKTFTTTTAVLIPAGTSGGGVVSCGSGVDVGITATAPGESFNVSGNFAINGLSSLFKATGSTSGGTTKTVTVVTTQDIERAKKEMLESDVTQQKQELANKASDDQHVFEETFSSEVKNFNSSVSEGSEASEATVSAQVKYSELAALKSDLDKLFSEQIKSQIPEGNQIYQSGSNSAKFSLVKNFSAEKAQITAVGDAFYGETIDTKQVAREVSGKSKKGAEDVIKPKYPQVTGVQVETNPALMPNITFFANRITIEIEVNTND